MRLNLKAWVAVLALATLLSGCQDDTPQSEVAPIKDAPAEVAPIEESTATEVDPNSMQAIQNAILARENHPGKIHFDQACAVCHNGAVKKAPHKDMLGLMTPESIFAVLNEGVMQQEAAALTQEDKIAVAEYIAGAPFGTEIADIPQCSDGQTLDLQGASLARNWGIQSNNNRHIETETAGLSATDMPDLKPKWAVSFPGANRARSQPAFAGGLMFVGSHNGRVYALDQESGCQLWSFQASGEVRTGIVIGAWAENDTSTNLYFGDVLGNVYSIDAQTGKSTWRIRADDHPNATITATPALHGDTVYIPVSSLEVSLAINPLYPCCTFRGSILAVDAASGETRWRTYTIEEEPTEQKKNAAGTPMMGPSGAVVWNTPSIDPERGQIYFGTGENMSSPATLTSDALFALDMQTGKVNWVFQATANDAWNVACDTDTPASCPEEDGPDFDFGGPTILVKSVEHGDLVVAGQKSGFVHALNPDTGAVVWQTRVGRGGIQGGIHFGMAAAGQRLFVPISDMTDGRQYDFPDSPGMHALDINNGEVLWSRIHEDICNGRAFCHPGISQVPTVIGDTVVAGAMDGWIRAYAIDSGKIVWSMDSTQEFGTVLEQPSRGGSFGGAAGPIALNGMLIFSSGYGIYNHMAGNLLMVLDNL